jgi:hypothetical protein
MPVMLKSFEDMQKLNPSMDSAMKMWGDWAKGWQTIAAEMTDYSKRSFEDSSKTFESLLSVKSPEQVLEIQTGYAKRAYEDYMRQMTKFGTLYTEIAKDAVKPLEQVMKVR